MLGSGNGVACKCGYEQAQTWSALESVGGCGNVRVGRAESEDAWDFTTAGWHAVNGQRGVPELGTFSGGPEDDWR